MYNLQNTPLIVFKLHQTNDFLNYKFICFLIWGIQRKEHTEPVRIILLIIEYIIKKIMNIKNEKNRPLKMVIN